MPETFVVREPIFDRDDAVAGYELRFEDATDGGDPFARAFLSGTFEALRAGKPAFIRCTRQQLLGRVFHTLDPKSIVVLLRPQLEADDGAVNAVHALTEARIPVALDDYGEHCASAPLLAHAPLVRLDLRRYSQGELQPLATRLHSLGRRLMASQVPDGATRRLCVSLGFELFQGAHFSRQEPLPTSEIPASTKRA